MKYQQPTVLQIKFDNQDIIMTSGLTTAVGNVTDAAGLGTASSVDLFNKG